jgi:hypothetical protein
MAAPSEEKLICDKFNFEALAVNQVKSMSIRLLIFFQHFVRPKINLFLFYTNNNKLGNRIESLATIYF